MPISTPGILFRFCQTPSDSPAPRTPKRLGPEAKIKSIHKYISHDGIITPNHMTMYFLDDITPLTADQDAFDQDFESHASDNPGWIICSIVVDKDEEHLPTSASTFVSTQQHILSSALPSPGSIILVVEGRASGDDDEMASQQHDEEKHDGPRDKGGWVMRCKVEKEYPWGGGGGGDEARPKNYSCSLYSDDEGGEQAWQEIEKRSEVANERRVWKFDGEVKTGGGTRGRQKSKKSTKFDDMW